MKALTKQEVFDIVTRHLLTQNERAASTPIVFTLRQMDSSVLLVYLSLMGTTRSGTGIRKVTALRLSLPLRSFCGFGLQI